MSTDKAQHSVLLSLLESLQEDKSLHGRGKGGGFYAVEARNGEAANAVNGSFSSSFFLERVHS
jgi:hypothetical protein